MEKVINSAIFLSLVCLYVTVLASKRKVHSSSSDKSSNSTAMPSLTQAEWLDYEVGASIHFNMQTFNKFMKRGDVVPPDTFNPRNLSTDQWVNAATSFGAKYIVLTLDHFSGFLLWPSETYNYSVKSTKWRGGKGDIARDFIHSCKKAGIKYGFFYSVNKNWFMNVEHYKTKSRKKQKKYNEIVLQQLGELFRNTSKYSKPFYMWFDAGTDPEVNPAIGPLIRSLAKDTLCDECKSFAGNQGLRWVGNENAVAPLPNWYTVPKGKCDVSPGDPTGEVFCPASCDTVIREHYWFWFNNTEDKVKTPQRLIQEYLTSVGRGCNLILNLNPDDRGLVPDIDLKVYQTFGQGIQLLYKSRVVNIKNPMLIIRKAYNLTVKNPLEVINGSLVVMEDIALYGQLVKKYIVEYCTRENKTITEQGTSVGHKRIHSFPKELHGLTLVMVNINITTLVTRGDKIVLREIAIYDWSEAQKQGYLNGKTSHKKTQTNNPNTKNKQTKHTQKKTNQKNKSKTQTNTKNKQTEHAHKKTNQRNRSKNTNKQRNRSKNTNKQRNKSKNTNKQTQRTNKQTKHTHKKNKETKAKLQTSNKHTKNNKETRKTNRTYIQITTKKQKQKQTKPKSNTKTSKQQKTHTIKIKQNQTQKQTTKKKKIKSKTTATKTSLETNQTKNNLSWGRGENF